MQLFDKITVDAGGVRKTADGYLVASPRVARVGIQLYRGDEVGRPDLPVVKVMRPEAEVFNADALHTFAYRPITNDHPPVPVTADNWRKHSVGQSGGEVARDGDFIRVPMALMDGMAIRAFQDGKAELSVGYTCDLKWEPGEYNGEKYDAIQTNIRANHIALVGAARGGDKLKFGDSALDELKGAVKEAITAIENGDTQDNGFLSFLQSNLKGDKSMTEKTLTIDVDGVKLEVGDTAASVINRTLQRLGDEIASLKQKLAEEEEAKKKAEAAQKDSATEAIKAAETKDAEIATLKKQLDDAKVTPEKLDAMVKDRAEVVAKAKTVIGDKLVVDGKSIGEIRRQVVDAKMGDVAKGWSDDQVAASFASLTADAKVAGGSAVHDMSRAFTPGGASTLGDSYKKYDNRLQDAWKTPAGV